MSRRRLDPALDRALLAARDRRERRGGNGDATVVVEDLQPDEALALDGLLAASRRSPVLPGAALRISLSRLEDALRACGCDPHEEYERVAGRPLRDLPAERAARRTQRADFRAWLDGHEVVRARQEIGAWLQQALYQGRVNADLRPLVERALAIVAQLPAAEPLQRTVLAAHLPEGDPHALDVGTPLHGLTVAMLAAGSGLDPGASPRAVWGAWNVLVDPVSSTVAALNLPLCGDGPAAAVIQALDGIHVVLTYGQLSSAELGWPAGIACFSCENPSVLIAAERELGASCPPLVCTGGRPSDAVRLVFDAVHRAGAPIFHHGDFDDAGVQIFDDLAERYAGRPWRFDLDALNAALRGLGRPSLADAASLRDAVRHLPSPIAEELLIDELLCDLHAAAARTAS